jgi:hypothetical protein
MNLSIKWKSPEVFFFLQIITNIYRSRISCHDKLETSGKAPKEISTVVNLHFDSESLYP